jgi:hypothetical protein
VTFMLAFGLRTKHTVDVTYMIDKTLPHPRMGRSAALLALAHRQGGYFTAAQARILGYVKNHHGHHLKSGAWQREGHGLYRLTAVPQLNPAMAELHLWLLWTMRRESEGPQGALACETALVVQGLSDLMLDDIHLWVPPAFRASVVPKGLVLHRRARPAQELTIHEGLRVVRPLPTLLELLDEGRVSEEHIERGLFDGIQQGSITRTELAQAVVEHAGGRRLYDWLLRIEPQTPTLQNPGVQAPASTRGNPHG